MRTLEQVLARYVERRDGLLPLHRGELAKKFIEGFAAFEVIEQ